MDSHNGGGKTPPSRILDVAFDLWRQSDEQHTLPITGTSMNPLFQEGDTVLVSHDCATIVPGMVVVFRQKGDLVAHRVVAIHQTDGTDPVYQTKGDNSPSLDPILRSNDILGKVVAIQRNDIKFTIDTPIWRWLNQQIVRSQPWRPAQSNILGRSFMLIFASILKTGLALFRWWKIRPHETGTYES